MLTNILFLGMDVMIWKFTFWLTASLLVFPLPFKLAGYISGKDPNPLRVKIQEITNAIYFSIGLVAFLAYAFDKQLTVPSMFWFIWLTIAVLWSCLVIFKSSKLTYAKSIYGGKLL